MPTVYKEEAHNAAAIVILCTLDQKHHYSYVSVMAMKKPISYLYNC